MDDDELTQDILDQFDLICTQHQLATTAFSNTTRNSDVKNQSAATIHVENKRTLVLNRTTSLDLNVNSTVHSAAVEGIKDSKATAISDEENIRLKKEIAELREQLYMKLGELSTFKESANRLNATKSDAISRLETSLNVEREEFQRKINELTAQLAFREADYRLVSTELTHVKEKLASVKSIPSDENLVEYSPASQLISAAMLSPQLSKNSESVKPPPFNHLPTPVTPIPTRRRPANPDSPWILNLKSKSGQVMSPSERRLRSRVDSTHPDSTGSPRKRIRRESPEQIPIGAENRVPVSDAAVETDPVLGGMPMHRKLAFRISRIPSACTTHQQPDILKDVPQAVLCPEKLAFLLSRIDVTTKISPDKDLACIASNDALQHDEFSHSISSSRFADDDYLTGMHILNVGFTSDRRQAISVAAATYRKRLCLALPHILTRMEQLFPLISSLAKTPSIAYSPKPEDASAETFLSNEPRGENEALNYECDDEIGYLGEDPFAGAPASQIVVPLAVQKKQQRVTDAPRNATTVTRSSVKKCSPQPPVPRGNSLWKCYLRYVKQLHLIIQTLHLYQMSADGGLSSNSTLNVKEDVLQPIQPLIHLISRLISHLNDHIIDTWKGNKQVEPYQSASTQTCFPTPSSLNVPSQRRLENHSGLEPFANTRATFVPIMSLHALSLTANLAALIGSGDLRNAAVNHSLDSSDFPSFADCIVLAHGSTHPVQNPMDCCALHTKPLVAMFRLLRSMSWSSSWAFVHHRDAWWESTVAIESEGGQSEQFDGRSAYLRRCFGSKPQCRLSVLIDWTHAVAEKMLTLVASGSECLTNEDAEQSLVALLDEFSGFVASLVTRVQDVSWPDGCSCKAQVYSTLVQLSLVPLQRLLTVPISSWAEEPPCGPGTSRRNFYTRCIIALGQMTRAFTGLRWRHGDQAFQSYTDCLPSYFFLISSLSSWIQQMKLLASGSSYVGGLLFGPRAVLRPELVEELFDFESSTEKSSS